MKITTISYRALRTGRGYNNTAVEASAEIGPDEEPGEALASLRAWVDGQVDEQLKRHDLMASIADLNESLGWATKEMERVEARKDAAREFIKECRELVDLARREGKGGIALLLENLL